MTELYITQEDVRHAVEDGISDIYHRIATTNDIPGDESPDQGMRREEIEERLTNLVCEWLNQNDTRTGHGGLE